MTFRVYNALSRTKEPFESLEPGVVRMYNCGPTVYKRQHIGNFRSFVFADLLRKMLVGEMSRAGVKIIAGTDVLNPYCFPGFSLHDELQLLVESGLTPMQALQAATKNAAEFSTKLDVLGTVEEGKIADLVLLDANPLIDISNTTQISTVIFDGRVNSREMLDEMLESVKSSSEPLIPAFEP